MTRASTPPTEAELRDAYGTPKACDSREIDDPVCLHVCNSRHGGHDTDPCKFLARMSDAGCGGCKYRGTGQASEANHEND